MGAFISTAKHFAAATVAFISTAKHFAAAMGIFISTPKFFYLNQVTAK
jgi:hypothetical protein